MSKLLEALRTDAVDILDAELPGAAEIPGLLIALFRRLEHHAPTIITSLGVDLTHVAEQDAAAAGAVEQPPIASQAAPVPSESAGIGESAGSPSEQAALLGQENAKLRAELAHIQSAVGALQAAQVQGAPAGAAPAVSS